MQGCSHTACHPSCGRVSWCDLQRSLHSLLPACAAYIMSGCHLCELLWPSLRPPVNTRRISFPVSSLWWAVCSVSPATAWCRSVYHRARLTCKWTLGHERMGLYWRHVCWFSTAKTCGLCCELRRDWQVAQIWWAEVVLCCYNNHSGVALWNAFNYRGTGGGFHCNKHALKRVKTTGARACCVCVFSLPSSSVCESSASFSTTRVNTEPCSLFATKSGAALYRPAHFPLNWMAPQDH